MRGEQAGRHLTTLSIAGLLAIVPLAYTTDIYDYNILPKRLALFVGTALAAIGWLLYSLRTNNKITISRAHYFLSSFCLLATLSLVNVTNFDAGLAELLFQYALVCLFVIGSGAKDRDTRIWLMTRTVTGGLISVIGILEYFDIAFTWIPSNGHPSATFGFRNFAAMFLVGVIPVCVFPFLLSRHKITITVSAFAGTLSILFLIYTRTRGAWLGVGVGLSAAFLLLIVNEHGRSALIQSIKVTGRLKPLLATLIVLLVVGAGPLPSEFQDSGLQRFDEKKSDLGVTAISILSGSGDRGRFKMWERSLPLIWDNLLTGVGPGHWWYVYPRYDRGAMIRSNSAPKRPHNDYVWIAAEHGLPALVVFLGFWVCVIIKGLQKATAPADGDRCMALIALAVVIGASVHALFSFPKEQPQIAAIVYLFGGVVVGRSGSKSVPAIPIWFAALLIAGAGTYITFRQIEFDRHYLAGLISEDNEDWHQMMDAAHQGLESGDFRPHIHVIRGRAHQKLKQLGSAESAYERALELSPNSWYAHNGLGVIKKRQGKHDEAMVLYEKALRIAPRALSALLNLGALYRAMGDDTRAEIQFREVLQRSPLDEGANNNLGNVLVARGEKDSAEVYFRRALDSNPNLAQANQNLGDILLQRQEYIEAIQHYLKAIEARPNKALIHWSLGSAYEAMGMLDPAEVSYRQAIAVEPEFPRSYFSLGTMLYGLHRWSETIALFDQFLSIWNGDKRFVTFAEGRIKACRAWIAQTEKNRPLP
ncbi:MAG: tetratricopeptide repeat protein [Candidatus Latescibacterota bacterium]|nr:tetratricopeptide repeat protein [Candidatus Latescibacterota bacterium]